MADPDFKDAKPIPSLTQWLGDGARAEGYEEWVRRMTALEMVGPSIGLDDHVMSGARMMKTLNIAIVEIIRIEQEQHGRTFPEIISGMIRMFGMNIMAAAISMAEDDAPLLKLAKDLGAEFTSGARWMAKYQLDKRGLPIPKEAGRE